MNADPKQIIEAIASALQVGPVESCLERATVIKVKKDYKYFGGLSRSNYWDVTVEVVTGKFWFRTYSTDIGEAIQVGDKISAKIKITKLGDENPKYDGRFLFGKLLTRGLEGVKIEKMNTEEPEAVGAPTVILDGVNI